jgi:hypothetical protein
LSLTGVRVGEVEVTLATLRVRVRGAWIGQVQIDGDISDLRINGVDGAPSVEAEFDHRYPLRPTMRPPTSPASARRGTPHQLSLPFDEVEPDPGVPWDRDVDVLEGRRRRWRRSRR